jgi:NADH dehydrogenase
MPIRHILRKQTNVEVVLGEVTGIDYEQKEVELKDGTAVPYDWLIIAAGSVNSYFGHDEWEKYAPGLKTLDEATHIRSEVLSAFESAERSQDPNEQKAWLTFLLIGAGATGVELAGAISEISRHVLKDDYKRIDPSSAKIILIEGGPRVLPAFAEDLSTRAANSLKKSDIELKLNTKVEGVDWNGVSTSEGRIDGKTIIWAAGVKASPVAKWLDVEADRGGRVKVNPDLTVTGREGVYVIGDCAYLEQDGQPLPGVAQVAIQQGKFAAIKIQSLLQGHSGEPTFHYKNLGTLATIGRSSAIAQFGKVHLSGIVAWVIWLFVHIMTLVGFRARLSVLLQWAWAYFTWDRGARIINPGN